MILRSFRQQQRHYLDVDSDDDRWRRPCCWESSTLCDSFSLTLSIWLVVFAGTRFVLVMVCKTLLLFWGGGGFQEEFVRVVANTNEDVVVLLLYDIYR